jgi:MoaA/NifB/PqqE/SkfB family radical SAM enzyme
METIARSSKKYAPMSELFARFGSIGTPYHVFLELTLRCNLKCFHCFQDSDVGHDLLPEERDTELTLDEIKILFENLAQLGVVSVALTGGEPFERRDIMDICRLAGDRGISIKIFTNGTHITDSVARQLKEANIRKIEVSLYGTTPESHETVTMVPGSFVNTLNGINSLMKHGIGVRIGTTFMIQNKHEVIPLSKLLSELGISDWRVSFLVSQDALGMKKITDMQIPFEEIPVLRKQLALANPDSSIKLPIRSCMAGLQFVTISPTGNVIPCAIVKRTSVGNIRKGPIKEIWTKSFGLANFVNEFDSSCRKEYQANRMLEKGLRPKCQQIKTIHIA